MLIIVNLIFNPSAKSKLLLIEFAMLSLKKSERRNDMRKIMIALIAVVGMLLLLSEESLAQRGRGGGWGPETQYGRMYNPQTVETVSGEVVKVEKITPVKGMSRGIHVLLKTDKETVPVHLGPAWYIDNQEVTIKEKDKLQVKGSRINFQGKPAIVAAEVVKGDQVLVLRDQNGVPAWSGWRRR